MDQRNFKKLILGNIGRSKSIGQLTGQIMKYVRECKSQGFAPDKEIRRRKNSSSPSSVISTSTDTSSRIDRDEIDDGWDTDFDEEDGDGHEDNGLSIETNTENNRKASKSETEERVPSHLFDINHNNTVHEIQEENTKSNIPKQPRSKPSISNYPKFVPLKIQQNNLKCTKRPHTVPPPPPPPLEFPEKLFLKNLTQNYAKQGSEEDYEIPNSSCDTITNSSSSSSLIARAVESVGNPSPSPQDMYESLDENDDTKKSLLDIPDVPPEAVPCTRSPSSRQQSSNSPSLPPRLTRGSPASYSPPPLPKKQEQPPSPPPPTEAKPRDIVSSANEKHNIMNRPLPLPPAQASDIKENDAETNKYLNEHENLKRYEWYHTVERDEAEYQVRKNGLSGTYLIRESRRGGISNPYTLTIFYNEKVYHLNIRKRPDHMYALGSVKSNELTFVSLAELVKIHQTDPILLSSKGAIVGQTCLVQTPDQES